MSKATTKTRAPKATSAAKGKTTSAKGKAKAAPAAKVDPDVIVASVGIAGGDKHMVKSAGGESITIPTARWTGALRDLSGVGCSYAAFAEAWSKASAAKLANGVNARNAPHSAKAVQDQNAKAKAAKPAKGTAAKAAKARTEAKKADKAKAKAAAKGNRTYKVTGNLSGVREGTWRHAMLSTIMAHTDTDSAKAALLKHKEFSANTLDFNWTAKAGYIQFVG